MTRRSPRLSHLDRARAAMGRATTAAPVIEVLHREVTIFAAFDEMHLSDMRKAICVRKGDVSRVASMAGHPQRLNAIAEEGRLKGLLAAIDAEAAARGALRLVAAVEGR